MQKYGQHFLVNQGIIQQIVDATSLLRAAQLVEIGPGKGALTQALLKKGNKGFTVIEIDPKMAAYLKINLPAEAQIKIICQNFLEFDLTSLPPVPTQFVSNLPYIDAAAILDKVLSWSYFKTAVFMFQKEQAQKITARPGDDLYGPLSVLSQLRARINLLCDVRKGSFNPPPKVDSRVLVFERVEPPNVPWHKLAQLIESAFLHRRKTLFNSLCLSGYDKEKLVLAWQRLHLTQKIRPEQVAPVEYVSLLTQIN